ncbi:pseudouridine synthase [Ferruginibacter lapsinanis]|uniref:pseudouridine synthase n=1 Tax=Ferruginibacter lapsinanis TaxID=563172 RepID=UPI0021D43197|nr:pseudouridine synthase [Ferruginibacter lapsinanis]UEG49170.1 pseudouridine synthase [Ferruginibacter lapsinanis]
MSSPNRYFVLNKPFDMVSQFVSTHNVGLLGDIDFDFPEGTHAIGRLDNHSEGLLLLTTNKKVTRLLFSSDIPHKRTYLVQVNKEVSPENLRRLQTGVPIKIKGGVEYITPPCEVKIVHDPEMYCDPGDRLTAYPPFTWLMITLTEGKFHQVRKMVNAVRHKCKRLIRVSIEDLRLDDLAPGSIREMKEEEIFRLLKITSAPAP